MARIVCFGELLLRLLVPDRGVLPQATGFDLHVGGAEANVAVALASLGHDIRMVSVVPDNPLGEIALGHLRRYGVDTRAVTVGQGRMGLYFLSHGSGVRAAEIVYDRQGSAFALAGPEDFDWPHLLADVDLLHLSGITPALGDRLARIALAAARAARTLGMHVSFDGNFRPALWAMRDGSPATILRELIAEATCLIGNHRDLSLVLGQNFTGDEVGARTACEAAFDAFPDLELIAATTRDTVQADAHHLAARVDTRQESARTQPISITNVVDRIGTGDAFTAGVLHAKFNGAGPIEIANTGLMLSALKHSLAGDACTFSAKDLAAAMSGSRDVRR